LTFLGDHTLAVQKGLNLGVILFIVSEALFFLAIFWAFFHSALTPTVELGAQWPPIGIEPVNPFELPLLNTVILLSSGATITYAHHSLIQGGRKGALYGSVATVLLAIIFTGFQGIEYNVSSFTISDGAFGTCFFFGTGFHGLSSSPNKNLYNIKKINNKNYSNLVSNTDINNKLNITLPTFTSEVNSYYLDRRFLEWFAGFTDGEGNFHIRLTALENTTYKYAQFTFQIGLHKDEIEVLEYIKNTLKCGHITKSKDKVNYFVNDINSLLYVIIPIFDYVNLNSSKYHHFVLFKKAVLLTKNKGHLSAEGKLAIIDYKKEMQKFSGKWIPGSIKDKINISKYWLAGFIDAEATFSTNKYVPRFKLENHIKELELYNEIREFFKTGNVLLTTPREYKVNSNPTIVLEINKVNELRDTFIPLMFDSNKEVLLRTLKAKDFSLWLKLVDMYYKGYHTTLEGKYVFDAIKLHMNKYRLTTNVNLLKDQKVISLPEVENLLSALYLSDSPYEIRPSGVRYIRNTNKLVSEATNIVVINSNNNRNIYSSMTECAKSLNISRNTIKQYLNTGKSYKGYTFVLI